MRKGFYLKLAAEGISKNRKFYFPYILTCICMVMMFYVVAYLSRSADFSGVFGGNMLQSMLGFGVFVIGIFSLIFLYYTNSFLIRRRQKEFGLYNILGMGKRNLVKILLWENVLTAAASIAAGLIFGILFSKLAEMAAMKILGGKTGFDMHIALEPIMWTVLLFLAISLLIMLRMVVSIFRLRPVEMLRSERTGEKPPKANWLIALFGAALLGAMYMLLCDTIARTLTGAEIPVAIPFETPTTHMESNRKRRSACKSTSDSLASPPGCVWIQRYPVSRSKLRRKCSSGSDTLKMDPTAISNTCPVRSKYTSNSRLICSVKRTSRLNNRSGRY